MNCRAVAFRPVRAGLKAGEGLMEKRLIVFVCLLVACFLAPTIGLAQENTADILGTITDAGGAVMPGVRVSALNAATNEIKAATSNAAGDYIFNLMQPGQYTLSVEAP